MGSGDKTPPVVNATFLCAGPGDSHPLGRPLKVGVAAGDDESGITMIAIGRESDNKPGLSDQEILATLFGPGTVTLSRDHLPSEPNSVATFRIVATNGIGLQSEPVSKVVRFFKPTTPELSTIGELEIQIHPDYRLENYVVQLKFKDGKIYTVQIPRGNASCVFEVPAGVYDLEINGTRHDYSVSGLEVVAGKRKTLPPIKPALQQK